MLIFWVKEYLLSIHLVACWLDDPMVGWLYSGKKSLQSSINVTVHSERIMQVDIMPDVGQVSLFNVYMPTDYQDMDSRDQFGMCIGELGCHIECVRVNTNYFGVIGDFNANCYGSNFFLELLEFCSENGHCL